MRQFNAPNWNARFDILVVVKISYIVVWSWSQALWWSINEEGIKVSIKKVLVSSVVVIRLFDLNTSLIVLWEVVKDLLAVELWGQNAVDKVVEILMLECLFESLDDFQGAPINSCLREVASNRQGVDRLWDFDSLMVEFEFFIEVMNLQNLFASVVKHIVLIRIRVL